MRHILGLLLSLVFAISAYAGSLQHQFERGIAAYKSGDYAMAGQKLKFVLEEHPRNLTALYYYGMSKHKLGTLRSAEKTLEFAHSLAPDVPEIRLALLNVYLDMDKLSDAQNQLSALKSQRQACGSNCAIADALDAIILKASSAMLPVSKNSDSPNL